MPAHPASLETEANSLIVPELAEAPLDATRTK